MYHFLSLWYDSTGIELQSPGHLANTPLIRPINWFTYLGNISYNEWKKNTLKWNIFPVLFPWVLVNFFETKSFGVSPHDVEAYVLDCHIIISEIKLQSWYHVHFWIIPLGKAWTRSFPELWVKWYHCFCSIRIVLVLNDTRKLICHQITKWNQRKVIY